MSHSSLLSAEIWNLHEKPSKLFTKFEGELSLDPVRKMIAEVGGITPTEGGGGIPACDYLSVGIKNQKPSNT